MRGSKSDECERFLDPTVRIKSDGQVLTVKARSVHAGGYEPKRFPGTYNTRVEIEERQ